MEKETIEIPKQTRPFGIDKFYRELKSDYTDKYKKALENIEKTIEALESARRRIENHTTDYQKAFDIILTDYKEYVENKYIDGELEAKAVFLYRNYKDDKLKPIILRLVKYAALLKTKHIEEKNAIVYYKILTLSYKDYKNILRTYYYEVQHQMIANGYCYKFSCRLGWLCINRVKNRIGGKFKVLDTKATKAKKEELRKQGIELYDSEKALYCKLNNIPYHGVKYVQYKDIDHSYEIVLVNSKIKSNNPLHTVYVFEPSNFWSAEMRKKTQEQIEQEAEGKIRYVTSLNIPFRRKLLICDKMDKTLYVNFIRNENQTSLAAPKNYR